MEKIDKYLLFQTLDNIIMAENQFNTPKEILDSIMWDLKKIQKMVDDF